MSSGALRPVVNSLYPLDGAAAANWAVEQGGVLGKHVIAVSG